MTKNSPYSNKKEWDNRVNNALTIIEKSVKEKLFRSTHTADDKKIKNGLKVFHIDDPEKKSIIIEVSLDIDSKRNVKILQGDSLISTHTSSLYVNQLKAVNAAIMNIGEQKRIIMRNMKESLDRLDAGNRLKELAKLQKKIK